ncbi:enhancer of split mgamma protein [Drosophila mauritiana]|uniref:Enhancer of split mgamma protein n=1 Tax=Drosophila mauritiana TaxID=7226 RepID=A0A6P8KMB2_DROMA|nr:enhancer of split mgamma protein [Drosophila mauritiana]
MMASPEEQESHLGAQTNSKSRSHQYRDVFKPMIEKKRRSRINRCLEYMKELLLEVSHLDAETMAKMDMADVLELAVHHLTKKNCPVAPHTTAPTSREYQSPIDCYWSGFRECILEVSQFLQHNGYQANSEFEKELDQLMASTSKSQPNLWRPW